VWVWEPLLMISCLEGRGGRPRRSPTPSKNTAQGLSSLCLLSRSQPVISLPPCHPIRRPSAIPPQRSHIPPPQDFLPSRSRRTGGEMRSHARSRRRCRASFGELLHPLPPDDRKKNRNWHRCMHAHGPVRRRRPRRRARMPSVARKFGPTSGRYEARSIPSIGAWPWCAFPVRTGRRARRRMEVQRSPSPVVATEQGGFRLRSWTARES